MQLISILFLQALDQLKKNVSMKQVLLGLLFALFCAQVCSEEENIQLQTSIRSIDICSLFIIPIAAHKSSI